MYNFEVETQGTNTYLVYKKMPDDEIDTMSLGMLTNNKINGFVQTFPLQLNADYFIKYNISSKITLEQLFNAPVNKVRLMGVLESIINGLQTAEDYMIDLDLIILDLKYIYVDVTTCKAELICLPISNGENNNKSLSDFFKQLMFNIQFDSSENCDHIAKLFNFLNANAVFTVNDFKKVLIEIQGNESSNDKINVKDNPVRYEKKEEPVIKVQAVKPVDIPQNNIRQNNFEPIQSHRNIKPELNTMNNNVNQVSSMEYNKHIDDFPVANDVNENAPEASGEKEMSFFNLLSHYSKENAKIYKAQKAARKSGKKQAPVPPANNQGFNIPGQNGGVSTMQKPEARPENNLGFSIPGQNGGVSTMQKPEARPENNLGFSIPGQNNNIPQAPKQYSDSGHDQEFSIPVKTPNINSSSNYNYAAESFKHEPAQKKMNFGDTVVLDQSLSRGTTVLSESDFNATPKSPYLIRKKDGSKVRISKDLFTIGKEKNFVDYCIDDNMAISRSHASIIKRGESYFVVDTNSTNHTYVNNAMCYGNTENLLNDGDEIKFANEVFEFRFL